MALKSNMEFNDGPLPVRDDGSLALVILSEEAMKVKGIEYYHQPVAVTRWSGKLKTTIDPVRLAYEDVVGWIEI